MDKATLQKAFEERAIRRVKVGGFDIDGVLRGKYISLEKFWSSVDKGFGFCDVIFGWDIEDALYDRSSVTGWESGFPDALAKIDLETFRVLPSEPHVAHFLVDFCTPNGKAHPACPRSLLKRVAAQAESAGFRAKFSAELEFWVFRESPASVRDAGFRNLEPLSPGMFGYSWVRGGQYSEWVNDCMDTLQAYDIDVEGLHTETGPGVWEVALRYDDIVRAADKAALFKTTMKQICHRHGLIPTFMAKWNAQLPGSSGHLHQSLWDGEGETNLFSDPKDENGLSRIAKSYAAGNLKLAPELTACYSPFVNTYKRYVPGVWAPMSAGWGVENRTCVLRAITGPGSSAVRLENRQGAADLNPYIAMAAGLGSGLYGITNGLEAPALTQGDGTAPSAERPALPTTLGAAIEALRGSDAAREVLGEPFVDHYVMTRDWEWRQYGLAVTNWELERYFESV